MCFRRFLTLTRQMVWKLRRPANQGSDNGDGNNDGKRRRNLSVSM